MPNWCNNVAEFHNDNIEAVNKLEIFLRDNDDTHSEDGLLSYFRPIPKSEEDNWYDWSITHWGTKWEASLYGYERVNDNTIKVSFDTAWSPPIAFYEWMADNTEWYINASYYECGMGFVGRVEGRDDYYYQYSDLASLDFIPQDIVDEWGIRESLEEYESEMGEIELTEQKNTFDDEFSREWLKNLLKERVVGVVFTKKDGSERAMKATLNEKYVPIVLESENSSVVRKKSEDSLPVWDIEAQGWRSFRWDSIKSVDFTLGE